MLGSNDYICSICNNTFESASSLLKHFAEYVKTDISRKSHKQGIINVPALFTIEEYKSNLKKANKPNDAFEDIDSGFEDINPMSLCKVSLQINQPKESKDNKEKCSYCNRTFKSTDLKKHVLTHTADRPFKCLYCCSSFMRQSALTNHKSKCFSRLKMEIPALKPIDAIFKCKKRKQNKASIKRML